MKQRFKKPSKNVSERMKKVKSTDTNLEKTMEKTLRSLHIKYEKQPDLEGCPDFRIKGTNILIFCDSSFWHGKREKEITGEAFKKNREFWKKKLIENRKRDTQNNRALRRSGWSVQRFWDTDILKKPDKVINRLRRIINETIG
ncbi:MAG: very short patch repair endonuclease [Euryarchaeota archaeon CG01_land_8_20_14_3_00_38_12]|nr:MAG: very short patch repair endonuclease [Euryarchaeota archaeon CG01_land_8_20_14_3_00_38_12]PJB22253.1 MAG: very short patch repair endonuclease [Euryarchaeota archaeon CG_4_9_14_3_um_filter_38_12]